MRSNMAPSAANFLIYGASNLTPRICSKSLFSSTTTTMWSYTGSVGGHGGLLAAPAVPAAHDKRAMTHACEIFGIRPPTQQICACARGRERCESIGADASTFNCVRIPAPHWLCYHCIHALLMAVDARGDDHAQSQDCCKTSGHAGAGRLHVVRGAKTSSLRIQTAAGGLLALPLPARK